MINQTETVIFIKISLMKGKDFHPINGELYAGIALTVQWNCMRCYMHDKEHTGDILYETIFLN